MIYRNRFGDKSTMLNEIVQPGVLLFAVQGTVDCTQQVQVTAFQSVQQAQPTLSPTNSYEVDSPMAKALAASAAGTGALVA